MSANLLNRAIQSLRPNSEYTFNDEDYSTINWIILEGEAPKASEIKAEMDKIEKADAEKIKADAIRKTNLLAKLGITEEEAKLLLS